ncbi:MAG: hypothetical protein V1859_01605 [archaeon]
MSKESFEKLVTMMKNHYDKIDYEKEKRRLALERYNELESKVIKFFWNPYFGIMLFIILSLVFNYLVYKDTQDYSYTLKVYIAWLIMLALAVVAILLQAFVLDLFSPYLCNDEAKESYSYRKALKLTVILTIIHLLSLFIPIDLIRSLFSSMVSYVIIYSHYPSISWQRLLTIGIIVVIFKFAFIVLILATSAISYMLFNF